jgi:hypothetical protein
MAEKKTIEVTIGQKGRKEGEGGKDAAAPPQGGEVAGHSRPRIVMCPHCGALRYVVDETRGICGWSTCGNCGGDYWD